MIPRASAPDDVIPRGPPAGISDGLLRYRVLVVDDSAADRLIITRLLEKSSAFIAQVHECQSAEQALPLLANGDFDCALVDFQMPGQTGVDLLRSHLAARPQTTTAVIVVTDQGSEDLAMAAIHAGAADYLPKGRLSGQSVARAVLNAVEKTQLRHHLAQKSRDLEERNAVLAERNEHIRRFYQTICHELRTPLAVTREFLSIVADEVTGPVTSQQGEALGHAVEGCDQFASLLDDLMDGARLQTGKLRIDPRSTVLLRIMEPTWRSYLPRGCERSIDMRLELPPSLASTCVIADALRIQQVIGNLLGNAIKFTPAGGAISLRAFRTATGICLAVRDSGCGIAPEHQRRILEPLYQVPQAADAHHGGLGLGLSISSDIVKLHGSTLSISSEPGKGSIFSFELLSDGS